MKYVYVKRYLIMLVISFHTDIPTCQERTKKRKTKQNYYKIKPKHKKHTHKKAPPPKKKQKPKQKTRNIINKQPSNNI